MRNATVSSGRQSVLNSLRRLCVARNRAVTAARGLWRPCSADFSERHRRGEALLAERGHTTIASLSCMLPLRSRLSTPQTAVRGSLSDAFILPSRCSRAETINYRSAQCVLLSGYMVCALRDFIGIGKLCAFLRIIYKPNINTKCLRRHLARQISYFSSNLACEMEAPPPRNMILPFCLVLGDTAVCAESDSYSELCYR